MQQTNIIESTQTNTQFYYEISSASSMILVTKPRLIITNSSFQLVMLLSKPIRVELSLNVELYVSGFSISSSSKWILESNSQDNQNYFWRFSSLCYVGDYLIRYWISNTLTSEKTSNIMIISDIVSVLPIPLLKVLNQIYYNKLLNLFCTESYTLNWYAYWNCGWTIGTLLIHCNSLACGWNTIIDQPRTPNGAKCNYLDKPFLKQSNTKSL